MALQRLDVVALTSDEYPQSSTQIQFGRGYTFASKPRGPDQITVRLFFPQGLWYFEDPVTRIMNAAIHPKLNILALKAFYETHRMYEPFEYDHPHRGVTVYRFSKPLVIPKISSEVHAGGYGGYRTHQTEPFDLSLLSSPL